MKMNKKMRDLLTMIEQKRNEAMALPDTESEKKAEITAEVKKLLAQYADEQVLYESEELSKEANDDEPAKGKTATGGADEETETAKFFKAARNGFVKKGINREGDPDDGGYTVPEDIVTKVRRYRDTQVSLLKYVRVEPVTTNKGERTYLKRSNHTGFSKVGEGGKIGRKAGPSFSRVGYDIGKYAGYIPVTNELLKDSDEAIEKFIVEWMGRESAATANRLILGKIAEKEAVKLDGYDGIKNEINVTLGSEFAATSIVLTNDSGLNYLDTLKDETGRYLLSPDPVDPMKRWLTVGARRIPLEVLPNKVFPNVEVTEGEGNEEELVAYQIPFILGDLYEAIAYFDREQLSVKASDVAVVGADEELLNAFEDDLTILRGLEREDVQEVDDMAFVNGYIEIEVPANP